MKLLRTKAELHAHLNGSVPFSAVRELTVGALNPDDYLIQRPVPDLESYFLPWAVSRILADSPKKLLRLTSAVAKAFAEDGVRYAELRNSVRHLAHLNGITLARAIEWLLDAFELASGYHNIDLRLIVTLTREGFCQDYAEQILDVCSRHRHNVRLVGIDLAGNELLPIPLTASRIFRRASEELGLGVTIHAGEVAGTEPNIEWAIKQCKADRIGHAIEAAKNEYLLQLISETDTCIEVCMHSNWLTSSVPDPSAHPVSVFVERNVPFVICTDNPGIHARPLSKEYDQFLALTNSSALLDEMLARQMRYSFKR
jgi:adenosine deaminase